MGCVVSCLRMGVGDWSGGGEVAAVGWGWGWGWGWRWEWGWEGLLFVVFVVGWALGGGGGVLGGGGDDVAEGGF